MKNEIAPEQLPSYSQEILTNYSIQPLDDDSYDYRKATAIIPPDLEESLVNVPLLIPEEYAKNTSPLNSGQKHETITAEIYIRNPKNLKSTIINISASDKKMRKPCWMIVKSYQSSCNIFDENISNENFINKGIVRIRSDTNLNEKAENSQITNLPKSTKKQPSTITTIPAVKQEESEENQAKTNLIFSDSELQSKMNHDLTIETQIETSIRSKITTRKTIPNTDMISDDFQTLITLKTDEIFELNIPLAFNVTPSDIPIGHWQMIIRCIKYLCILFNPWSKGYQTKIATMNVGDIVVTMNYKQQTNLNSSLSIIISISIDKPISGYLVITNGLLSEQTVNTNPR
ncbi:Glycerol-3-phosphate dehydrogenase [Dirofilaria immitis]